MNLSIMFIQLTMRGFYGAHPGSLHNTYYNFAWVPHTFGGVWPPLTLLYFAHWLFASIR